MLKHSEFKFYIPVSSPGTKGQLVSEENFGVFKSPKKWTLLCKEFNSSLASKMGQKNKIKAVYKY